MANIDKDPLRHVGRHEGRVTLSDREQLLKQKPFTVWFTGLSGSGKSTLGFDLEKALIDRKHLCYVLDGDNIRLGLSRNLSFSPEDRTENIRRVAEVSRLFNDAGLIVITSFISPYARDRLMASEIIGPERFVEVFLAANVAACEQRDPKGLYAKARSGQIADFTGVSAPYEMPANPALTLDTATRTKEECLAQLIRYLINRFP